MLRKLAEQGAFTVRSVDTRTHFPMPLEALYEAIEEFLRDIEAAYDGVTMPTGARRLSGLLFVHALEEAVTSGRFQPGCVTIQE
jgi:hypothetical protein